MSLGIGLVVLTTLSTHMRNAIESRNSLVAETLARDVETLLDGYRLALSLLGEAEFWNQGGVESLAAIYPAFSSVLIADDSGRVEYASSGSREAYYDISRRDYFMEPSKTGLPYLSASFIAEGEYSPTAVLAVPIDGGVAIGHLSFSAFGAYVASLAPPGGETVSVTDRNGIYVAHGEADRVKRRESAALEDWYADGGRSEAGSGIYERPNGRKELVCWAPLAEPSGWTIIISQPEERVFEPVSRARVGATLAFGLTGLAALVFIAMAVGSFRRDIRALRAYTAAIASGDYGVSFSYRGFRDLSDLASDYVEAAAAIREREALIQLNERRLETLLKEVHHRVKNNLQLIVSLLSLKAGGSEEVDDAFAESIDRIRVMATIHETLYESRDFSHIDLGAYVRTIVEWIMSSYAHGPTLPRLSLELEPVTVDIDAAVPCGLIVNELFTNTIKYAFGDDHPNPTVSVGVARDAGGAVVLSVGDNGRGLPADIEPERAETLGLQLIVSLAAQLKGSWSLDRSGGTAWTVRFARPPWPMDTPGPLDEAEAGAP